MITGIITKSSSPTPELLAELNRVSGVTTDLDVNADHCVCTSQSAFLCRPSPAMPKKNSRWSAASQDGQVQIFFEGVLYNHTELIRIFDISSSSSHHMSDAEILLHAYKKEGENCLLSLNGKYVLIVIDSNQHRIIATSDRMGEWPLYYYDDNQVCLISNVLATLRQNQRINNRLNHQALMRYMAFGYIPSTDTLFHQIQRLQNGCKLVLEGGKTSVRRYWTLSFKNNPIDEKQAVCRLSALIENAVDIRINDCKKPGIFLSGGLDSSTIAAVVAQKTNQLHCFSYYCSDTSYDEVNYARAMADALGASHQTVAFTEKKIDSITSIVPHMDEPFCDIGINIATFLVGQLAQQHQISCVLSGDGGDELFGGHPVYLADKGGIIANILPAPAGKFIATLSRLIPDNENKKDISVKAKRFLQSLRYPKALLTHRWRALFDSEELGQILHPDYIDTYLANNLNDTTLFAPMFTYNREANCSGILGRSIYSDYQTTVIMTMRRLALIESMGVNPRPPFLDYRLAEFCAGLPSSFKIRPFFNTKYILKKTIQGLVPDHILLRKDKLGNSSPLKNWLRQDGVTRDFITTVLSEDTIKRRGIFKYPAIKSLLDEHFNKTMNHSHRLWELAVLELWMQHHLDN